MTELLSFRKKLFEVIEQGPSIGWVEESSSKRKQENVFDELKSKCDTHANIGFYAVGSFHSFSIHTIPDPVMVNQKVVNWETDFSKLYHDIAQPALSGNRKTGESEHNQDVRCNRDIDAKSFAVDEKLMKKVHQAWKKSPVLWPKEVSIVPYKLNLYREKDYFKEHLDTPEDKLVATFVVSWYSSKETSALILRKNRAWKVSSDPHRIPWCAFYTDVGHEVPPSEGDRVTLTFKVFSDETKLGEKEKEKMKLTQEIQQLATRLDFPLAILMSHNYTIFQETDTLKGADAILLEALRTVSGIRLYWISVSVKRHDHACNEDLSCCDDGDDDSKQSFQWGQVGETGVHYIRVIRLAELAKMSIGLAQVESDEKTFEAIRKVTPLPFRKWKANYGALWSENEEVRDSGNTGDYGDIHKIYITRALIALPI